MIHELKVRCTNSIGRIEIFEISDNAKATPSPIRACTLDCDTSELLSLYFYYKSKVTNKRQRAIRFTPESTSPVPFEYDLLLTAIYLANVA
jgi:hypothetical protein